MSLWFKRTLPLLHQAVLNNDPIEIKSLLSSQPELIHKTDFQGFSALEIAQFLGKQECVLLLQPTPAVPKILKIMHEGDKEPIDYNLKLFEKVFGVKYLPQLLFSNYESFLKVIQLCPLLLKTFVGKECRELGTKYRQQIQQGYVSDVTIKWIDPQIGYGVFANEAIPSGAYVGEYTGLVRQLFRFRPNPNPYCFHYPTRFWSWDYYIIDGLWQGNELRFLNHSEEPNLEPICILDRGILHFAFRANQPVEPWKELTFNYGPDFWRHRQMV